MSVTHLRTSPDEHERALKAAWVAWARRRPCAVCGALSGSLARHGPVVVRGHHVITQQQIGSLAGERGLQYGEKVELMWDRRNCLPLCDRDHQRHHSAARRVRLDELRRCCPDVFDFAREIRRAWLLDRYYAEAV